MQVEEKIGIADFVQSTEVDKIYEAMVIINERCPFIVNDGKNPFHKSTYTTLDRIQQVTNPVFNELGLIVFHAPVGDNKIMMRVTHLESKQFIQITSSLIMDKKTPQAVGSAITYMRRYMIVSFFAIRTPSIPDDDGQAAERNKKDEEKAKSILKIATKKVADAETIAILQAVWLNYPHLHTDDDFIALVNDKKFEITKTAELMKNKKVGNLFKPKTED